MQDVYGVNGRMEERIVRNPPHPGEAVREDVLHPLGLTIAAAARELGVRRATLSDLCRGKTALTLAMALKLEHAFGVSADLLLRMQVAHDLARIRRAGTRLIPSPNRGNQKREAGGPARGDGEPTP